MKKSPKSSKRKAAFWLFGVCAILIGAFAAAAYYETDKAKAMSIASAHAAEERNRMIAQTARWLTTQHWMLSDLGEDYLADKIRASDNPAPVHNEMFSDNKKWVMPTAIIARFEIPAADHPSAPVLIDAKLDFPVVVDTSETVPPSSDVRPDLREFSLDFLITDNVYAPSPGNKVASLKTLTPNILGSDVTPYAVE